MEKLAVKAFPANQLKFSLNPILTSNHQPTHFRPPPPIFIEKQNNEFDMPRQYSYISQDSMSEAVLAARHDLQHMKGAGNGGKRDNRAQSPTFVRRDGQTRIVNSVEYVSKMRKRQQQQNMQQKMVVKEKSILGPPRNVITQTYHPVVTHVDLPVRSMSPPTRDMTDEEKLMAEISRQRVEIIKCLQQIKQIESKRSQLNDYRDEDATERSRRLTRAEEQSVRSARIIYALNKQIAQLQEELRRTDLNTLPASKKNLFVNRLVSVHRAVVRALQIHVRHMSDSDVCPSVSASIVDLAAVLRQLSLCCAQFQVASDDSVSTLINDIVVLSKIQADTGKASVLVAKNSNDLIVKEKPAFRAANKSKSERNVSQGVKPKAQYDHRQSELRAGIQQLMKPPNATNNCSSKYAPANQKRVIKHMRSQPQARSVLIDRPSQARQPVTERDRSNAGYTESTVSKSLKETGKFQRREVKSTSSRTRPSEVSTDWRRRRSRSLSPERCCGCRLTRSRSASDQRHESAHGSPISAWYPLGDHRRSANNRQVNESATPSSSSHVLIDYTNKELGRQPSKRDCHSSGQFWGPLVSNDRYKHLARDRKIESDESFETGLKSVLDRSQRQMNMSNVSESLVNGLVSDVSRELHQHRIENIADRQSAFLRDAPSVDTLLQRLQEMELEQDAIRQRWTTLVYDDDRIIEANMDFAHRTVGLNENSDDNIILFTKPILGTGQREQFTVPLSNSGRYVSVEEQRVRQTTLPSLRLTSEGLRSIEQNVKNYENYLAKRSHNVGSKFNPWAAIEHIAEDILRGCIEDIVGEVEQINNELVDSVYGAEFSVV